MNSHHSIFHHRSHLLYTEHAVLSHAGQTALLKKWDGKRVTHSDSDLGFDAGWVSQLWIVFGFYSNQAPGKPLANALVLCLYTGWTEFAERFK